MTESQVRGQVVTRNCRGVIPIWSLAGARAIEALIDCSIWALYPRGRFLVSRLIPNMVLYSRSCVENGVAALVLRILQKALCSTRTQELCDIYNTKINKSCLFPFVYLYDVVGNGSEISSFKPYHSFYVIDAFRCNFIFVHHNRMPRGVRTLRQSRRWQSFRESSRRYYKITWPKSHECGRVESPRRPEKRG